MKDQMDYIVEIHKAVGKIEGKMESLPCICNDSRLKDLEKSDANLPAKAWAVGTVILSIIISLAGLLIKGNT